MYWETLRNYFKAKEKKECHDCFVLKREIAFQNHNINAHIDMNDELTTRLNEMDKAYKGLLKKEKSLVKGTKKVLAKDESRDKLLKAGKKAMKKGKC